MGSDSIRSAAPSDQPGDSLLARIDGVYNLVGEAAATPEMLRALLIDCHAELKRLYVETKAPRSLRLPCERCGEIHIDEGDFATKPHHTHSCQFCGLTWRPAVFATVGVAFLPGFKNGETPR